MTITRYILLILLALPFGVNAQAPEAVMLAGSGIEEQPMGVDLLFWSKVFILLLIVVFGFLSYRRFLKSEEQ